MKQIAVFATLIAAALCRPAEEILNYQADSQTHVQSGNAGVAVEGQYSYEGPDGKMYKLKYRADDNGFVAEGEHLPVAPEAPSAPAPAAPEADESKTPMTRTEEKKEIDTNAIDVMAADPAEKEEVAPAAAPAAAPAVSPVFAYSAPLVLPQVAVITQGDATNYPAATGPLPEVKYTAPVLPAPVQFAPIAPAPIVPAVFRAPVPVVSFEKSADDAKLPAATQSLVVPQFKVASPIPVAPAPFFWY